MTRKELLIKIRKCLALAKSANEHEAAAALATARRLMDEHGVDTADIAALDVEEASAKGSGAWTPSRWEAYLITIVTRAIPCKAIGCGDSGWQFIGLAPAPEIAAYAFTALYRQMRRARATYMAAALRRVRTARRKTQRADAYCEGWAVAVFDKVAAIYPKQALNTLVVTYLNQRYPDTRSVAPRETALQGSSAENDRGRGWAAGRDAQLYHGVHAASPALLGAS